jgi:hypothetical protein
MSYTYTRQTLPESFFFQGYSAPASIVYNTVLYIFYHRGDTHELFYREYDEVKWYSPWSVGAGGGGGIGLYANSSPCPVVFKDSIYLFYNGAGDDGVWLTKSAPSYKWTPTEPVTSKMRNSPKCAVKTSPTAAVYKDALMLFWNNRDNAGISYTSFDGARWTDSTSLSSPSVRAETSASVVVFRNALYLFYNGAGNDGTWMTALNNGTWTQVQALSKILENMGFLDKTSPKAFVSEDGVLMTLVWHGKEVGGLYLATTTDPLNPKAWSRPTSMLTFEPLQNTTPYSSPGGVWYRQTPYIFWLTHNFMGLAYSTGSTFNIDDGNIDEPLRHLASRQGFSIKVTDKNAFDYFQRQFGPGWTPRRIVNPAVDTQDEPKRKNFTPVAKFVRPKEEAVIYRLSFALSALIELGSVLEYDITFQFAGKNGLYLSFKKP